MIIPTIGCIVHYTLSEDDATQINRRRTDGWSIGTRIKQQLWPIGAQAHIGNSVASGDRFPAMIVRTWGADATSAVQLQVFLDGNDVFWATSVQVGEGPRTYAWPGKA